MASLLSFAAKLCAKTRKYIKKVDMGPQKFFGRPYLGHGMECSKTSLDLRNKPNLILDVEHRSLLIESVFFFQNESGVDGEREVGDRVEDVEDEDEHEGPANLVSHV